MTSYTQLSSHAMFRRDRTGPSTRFERTSTSGLVIRGYSRETMMWTAVIALWETLGAVVDGT